MRITTEPPVPSPPPPAEHPQLTNSLHGKNDVVKVDPPGLQDPFPPAPDDGFLSPEEELRRAEERLRARDEERHSLRREHEKSMVFFDGSPFSRAPPQRRAAGGRWILIGLFSPQN